MRKVAAEVTLNWWSILRPPPKQNVAEWADKEMRLSAEASAEPGRFRVSRAMYQGEIMAVASDALIHTVVVMSSAQVGKTTILLAFIGFHIDQDPSPILVLQPTLDMGQAFSKDRLAPLLRDTPALAGKVKDPRSRDSGNTLLHKALDIDTPIATPTGWTTMGALKVGDTVFDRDGQPAKITYVTPIETGRPCYRVTFSDGSDIVADDEHPWWVQQWKVLKGPDGKKRNTITDAIVTTRDLLAHTNRPDRKRFAIPVAKPIDTPEASLPIDPYVLGAWLGDGLKHRATVVAGANDAEMIDLLAAKGCAGVVRQCDRGLFRIHLDPVFGTEETCKRGHQRGPHNLTADGKCKECHRQHELARRGVRSQDAIVGNNVRDALKALGLLTRPGEATTKHIPPAYLRASINQRSELLRGLMDTDGSIRKCGYCIFVTAQARLRDDVSELLSSLGIKHVVKKTETRLTYKGTVKEGIAYRLEFRAPAHLRVFALSRKLERQEKARRPTTDSSRRRVVRVEPVESRPVRCITIDSESHVYLAGRQMVPTHNSFPGGHITIAGANSAASLASRPIRVLLADEVDRYPISAGTEGDPISLAKKRTTTFFNRKIILTSTPTVKGESRIEAAFEESDKRYFFVPCPHCEHEQRLIWSQVRWPEGDAQGAEYCCVECGTLWDDTARWQAVRRGRWIATSTSNGIAGFHLSELYSPWRRLAETVEDFLLSKADPERLRTWVNTALGETWEENGEQADASELDRLREPYGPEDLPEDVLYATAGVDTQGDRLEVEILGWGEDERSWGIEYHVLYGDPAQDAVWSDLDEVLQTTYRTSTGRLVRVAAAAIDSGGHHAEAVLRFCKTRFRRRVYPIKGFPGAGKPIWPLRSSKSKHAGQVFMVGVDTAKDTVLARWGIEEGPGACRLPADPASGYDEAWIAQATAEQRVTKYLKGRPYTQWVLPSGKRNEALDCRVYALAAMKSLPRGAGKAASAPALSPTRPEQGRSRQNNDWLNVGGNWL